ncbi:MAG: hypothetical protein E6Q89_07760 [Bacteroidia bacterium]|nr:MAG: hypothetical protein E6Q89_07760 [Bacteroidia bacterium]
MGQKIKLIWEYRGPEAQQIAEHYEHHLIEFIEEHKLLHKITGTERLSEMYSVAFMVVDESEIEKGRNILRPRKAVLYQE